VLAPVAIIEYSDFECSFCGSFSREAMPKLQREYLDTGKVLLAFRHAPIEAVHPRAVPAASAAECARQQGRFWDMHDKLFALPRRLDDEIIAAHVTALGLDTARFRACLDGGVPTIRSEIAEAAKLSISGRPTFFVGRLDGNQRVTVTRRLTGASFQQLKTALDEILSPRDEN
jgi:protein-disulfide isomerase